MSKIYIEERRRNKGNKQLKRGKRRTGEKMERSKEEESKKGGGEECWV